MQDAKYKIQDFGCGCAAIESMRTTGCCCVPFFVEIKGQGSGARDQGPGIRGQGSGARDQGPGIRGQGSGDQGPGIRGQGSGARDQGPGIRGQASGIRDQYRNRCCSPTFPPGNARLTYVLTLSTYLCADLTPQVPKFCILYFASCIPVPAPSLGPRPPALCPHLSFFSSERLTPEAACGIINGGKPIPRGSPRSEI